MGNVSVRGDGGFEEGHHMEEVVHDSSNVSYHAHEGSSELMGQSPPHSPRASQSPWMVTPQVPMVPFERAEEMNNPSHAWTKNSTEYEDTFNEQGIPTMITWSHGGKEVAMEGSWDNWKTRMPMQRSGEDFIIMKVLPSGVYQYRFLVDGQWRYAPELPWAHDDMGNFYNILDLQEYIPEDLKSIAGFEPPESPDSSYNNVHFGSEDFSKEPPLVPPHLQMTLLNVPTSSMDNHSSLSRPHHAVLNHLYVQKGSTCQSVLPLGTTHRFLSKYVTVVLYKSLQS